MNLELYSLKILRQVVEDQSFSKAGRTLGLSQPSVSQQIANLELAVGERLFLRLGHRVVPTDTGKEIYQFAVRMMDQMTEFGNRLQRGRVAPTGRVRYAMPESCQWTGAFRQTMARLSTFPGIQFDIRIESNDQILKLLLDGEIDFAFMVGSQLHPQLKFERFADEHYSLVASDPKWLEPVSKTASFRFLTYPGCTPFVKTWAQHHRKVGVMGRGLATPAVQLGTLAGAIHAVCEGAGAAVVPTHCVESYLAQKKLVAWGGREAANAKSPIYLAWRDDGPLPRRVESVMDLLRKAKRGELK